MIIEVVKFAYRPMRALHIYFLSAQLYVNWLGVSTALHNDCLSSFIQFQGLAEGSKMAKESRTHGR